MACVRAYAMRAWSGLVVRGSPPWCARPCSGQASALPSQRHMASASARVRKVTTEEGNEGKRSHDGMRRRDSLALASIHSIHKHETRHFSASRIIVQSSITIRSVISSRQRGRRPAPPSSCSDTILLFASYNSPSSSETPSPCRQKTQRTRTLRDDKDARQGKRSARTMPCDAMRCSPLGETEKPSTPRAREKKGHVLPSLHGACRKIRSTGLQTPSSDGRIAEPAV